MRNRVSSAVWTAAIFAISNSTAGHAACQTTDFSTAIARKALDGRTIELADGRQAVLAGIVAPLLGQTGENATAALNALIADREIVLSRLGAETDRYGRVVALIRPKGAENGGKNSAQAVLLSQGHAQVAARVDDRGCAAAFQAAEAGARAAGLGLWGDPHYLVRRAGNPSELLAQRGRFTLVEGQVVSVRESGGTIYVNFGRRWSEDFTVTVLKRHERGFVAAGRDLKKLSGRHVRVRGILEERGGPWIEAVRPEQIELAEPGR